MCGGARPHISNFKNNSLHPVIQRCPKIVIVMPNRCCIFELRVNQCFVINFITASFSICVFSLCHGLTSQSTIFQSCRDGATASWVLPVVLGSKVSCSRTRQRLVSNPHFGVQHSKTEPPCSPILVDVAHHHTYSKSTANHYHQEKVQSPSTCLLFLSFPIS